MESVASLAHTGDRGSSIPLNIYIVKHHTRKFPAAGWRRGWETTPEIAEITRGLTLTFLSQMIGAGCSQQQSPGAYHSVPLATLSVESKNLHVSGVSSDCLFTCQDSAFIQVPKPSALEKGFATVSLLPIEGVFLDHFLQSPSKENVSGQKKHCCTVYTHLYYVSKKSMFFLNPQETTTPHPLSKGGGRLPLAILRIV